MNDMNDKVLKPVIRKRQWPYNLIWILPLIVAVIAGLYFKDYLANRGPKLVIEFSDASGLRVGETKLMHRGAEVGRVTKIELTDDHKHALVHAEFDKNEASFATKGASFYIVRPEVSQSGLSGLGTLFSGPYISALPGKDEEEITKIDGLSHSPKTYEEGEHFTLTTSRMGHVQEGSGVYYKGVQVGSVQDIELASEADHLDVKIVVWSRFSPLVRANSKFWVASGFDFKAGLFSGVQMRLDSLKTLASGGVAFATPEKEVGPNAKSGSHFILEDEPKKEYDQWSPHISLSGKKSIPPPKPEKLPEPKKEKK